MAHLQCNFFSTSLLRTVDVTVIIPTDKFVFPPVKSEPIKEYKTLYLLHGIFGSHDDWINGTRIERWANDKNLVVVMPSGENMFYVDNPKANNNYGKFIGEELVDFTRKTFPLSHKKEDTFIGGLSMGGYGAIRNGLKYHDTFGAIVALSSALILDGVYASTYDEVNPIGNRSYYEAIFGNVDELKGSDKDYYALIEGIDKNECPKIYMACGVDDGLLPANEQFHNYLTEKEIDHEYVTGPGNHEWDFWDTYIKKALDWLPLDKETQGMSSGHVQVESE